MQPTNQTQRPALPRLEDLLERTHGSKKRPVNYLNYTKETYNILTLQKHNEYYQDYKRQLPVYVREQPDWNKSLYKKKDNKVTPYNYILYRNAKNLKNRSHSGAGGIPRTALYRSVRHNEEYSNSVISNANNHSCISENVKGNAKLNQTSDHPSLPLIKQPKCRAKSARCASDRCRHIAVRKLVAKSRLKAQSADSQTECRS